MVLWQPVDQKIDRATLLLGSNARPPTRPFVHECAEPDKANHFLVRGPLDYAHGRPVSIEPPARAPPRKDVIELILRKIIVPDIFGSSLQFNSPRRHIIGQTQAEYGNLTSRLTAKLGATIPLR